jgi:hypothetical protein
MDLGPLEDVELDPKWAFSVAARLWHTRGCSQISP